MSRITGIALAAMLMAVSEAAPDAGADEAPNVVVKAALLYNFAKFVEWPALASDAPIILCMVGNEGIAAAFTRIVSGQNISGHRLDVLRLRDFETWRGCNMLFIANTETGRGAVGLGVIKTLPILTISDGKGFAQAGGIIELYIERERIRFAINVDAAQRSGLRLSSCLLGLARIMRDSHVQ